MKNENFVISKKKALYTVMFALMIVSVGLVSLSLMPKPSAFHVYAYVQRAGSDENILVSYHAGSLTTAGKNFIEGILGDDAFANATHYIQFGSLSCNDTVFDAGWVNIIDEIVADGLERAKMTYASTGDGVWTMTHQWTALGTHTDVQRVGMNWDSVANDGSLAWADTITPVTLNSGDKLTIVATTTVTG